MSNQALLDLINKRKQETSRVKTISPNPGRNRYRVLPSWRVHVQKKDVNVPENQAFYHDFGQHFIKNAANEIKAVYICTDKTFGRPCSVCDQVSEGIRMSTSDAQKKVLEDARSNGRVLLNVLHLDGPSPNEPQILAVAPSVFQGKKGVGGLLNKFVDYPDLLDPIKGNDIIIERSGSGKDTTYDVSVPPSGSKPVPAQALERMHDLDKFVAAEMTEASQKRALAQVAAVSGLLPSGADIPSTHALPASLPASSVAASPAANAASVLAAAAAGSAAAAPQPSPVAERVVNAAPQPAAVASPVPAANAAPAAVPAPVAGTGDAELDALLADLGPK